MSRIRLLILAANPRGTERLALEKETLEIMTKTRLGPERDALELIPAFAATTDDVLQYLNQYRPDIVHFSGHGTSTGEISW